MFNNTAPACQLFVSVANLAAIYFKVVAHFGMSKALPKSSLTFPLCCVALLRTEQPG